MTSLDHRGDNGNLFPPCMEYGRAPRAMLRDPNLSAAAVVTWALLDDVAPGRFPGVSQLAEWRGVSVASVRRSIGELTEAGWVEVRESGGFSLVWEGGK